MTWLKQFVGAIVLMFFVWAMLNMPDQRLWQVSASVLLAFVSLAIATWLTGTNLAVRPISVVRYAWVFFCLVLLLVLLWSLSLMADHSWQMANWLASAFTMKRKKPVTPASVHRALDWLVFFVRWIVIPVIVLPLAIRATGARPVRFVRLALTWLVLFLAGAVLPHAIVHWVPKLPGFWLRMTSAGIRFLIAYILMISAWVILGRSVRQEGRT